MMTLYIALDVFFLIFHTIVTVFNGTGWVFKKTRKLHFLAMMVTSFSWFVLGIWYGWGYCFCTDWHWQVREAMGQPIASSSYIQFLIQELTGIPVDAQLTDTVVAVIFAICLILTIVLNGRDYLKKHKYIK